MVNNIDRPNLMWAGYYQGSSLFSLYRYDCPANSGDCLGDPALIFGPTSQTSYVDYEVSVAGKTQTPQTTFWYYVTAVNTSNKAAVNSTMAWKRANGGDLPATTELFANYPNPFNPTTNFEFQLADVGFVTLKIYNTLGQEVAAIVSEELQAGTYTREWNALAQRSGIYYARMSVTDVSGKQIYQAARKLLMIK